jgi:hypothetical protein
LDSCNYGYSGKYPTPRPLQLFSSLPLPIPPSFPLSLCQSVRSAGSLCRGCPAPHSPPRGSSVFLIR